MVGKGIFRFHGNRSVKPTAGVLPGLGVNVADEGGAPGRKVVGGAPESTTARPIRLHRMDRIRGQEKKG